jgi:hypothetical protein
VKPLYTLIIQYTNGSADRFHFNHYEAVRDTYQHGISYSGDRVRRVEVDALGGGLRAIWDASWDDVSKHAGLNK